MAKRRDGDHAITLTAPLSDAGGRGSDLAVTAGELNAGAGDTKGLLRQFFPKTVELTQITDKPVVRATGLLNTRPWKCLNYRTPREVVNDLTEYP